MQLHSHTAKLAKARFIFAALFFAVGVIAPQTARAQYLNPKITSKQTTIRNIVLLPAKVDIVRDSMKGPEGMGAESEELRARVEQLITETLMAKHITSLPASSN